MQFVCLLVAVGSCAVMTALMLVWCCPKLYELHVGCWPGVCLVFGSGRCHQGLFLGCLWEQRDVCWRNGCYASPGCVIQADVASPCRLRNLPPTLKRCSISGLSQAEKLAGAGVPPRPVSIESACGMGLRTRPVACVSVCMISARGRGCRCLVCLCSTRGTPLVYKALGTQGMFVRSI